MCAGVLNVMQYASSAVASLSLIQCRLSVATHSGTGPHRERPHTHTHTHSGSLTSNRYNTGCPLERLSWVTVRALDPRGYSHKAREPWSSDVIIKRVAVLKQKAILSLLLYILFLLLYLRIGQESYSIIDI